MSNLQNEPLFDITNSLGGVLVAQFPEIKSAQRGWPDREWMQADGNMPALRFIEVHDKGTGVVSRADVDTEIVNSDGTGSIVHEVLRLAILLQISLFASDKATRDRLGWGIKQYLIANPLQPILVMNPPSPIFDYATAVPAQTGERMILYYRGDQPDMKGELGFWHRPMTFEVSARVLNAVPGWQVKTTSPIIATGLQAKVGSPSTTVN